VVSPGWPDLDRGLFSISVAAELAGVHPQTLRIYEREGLIDPARSAGGTRRYSRRDIDRLQVICGLSADGLNLAGIRRVLELQEETRRLQAEVAALRENLSAWSSDVPPVIESGPAERALHPERRRGPPVREARRRSGWTAEGLAVAPLPRSKPLTVLDSFMRPAL